MEDDDKMPNVLDRRRLKDRIIEGVSKAVKKIQCAQCGVREDCLLLSNTDYHFHKLIESLDHAFLHGLRHITNGYWVVVQHFTHKMTVEQVQCMTNVTTHLGRGRAWLYLALCDQLLESYIRCFAENTKLVKKYYVSEALILDQQRMQILLMLASGLEHIIFELDADVPYLDLSSHMSVRPEKVVTPGDRVSLCSMESSMSQCSMASPASQTNLSECSDTTVNSDDTNRHSSRSTSATELEQTRIDRIGKITPNGDLAIDSDTGDLEVIHVKRKVRGSNRRKTLAKRKTLSAEVIDPWSAPDSIASPQTPESGYRSVADRTSPCCKSLNDGDVFDVECYSRDGTVFQGASSVGCRSDVNAAMRGADREYRANSFYSSFSSDVSWTAAGSTRSEKAAVNCLSDDSSRLSAVERINDATKIDSERLSTETNTVTQEIDQCLRDSGRSLPKPTGSRDTNTSVPSVSNIDNHPDNVRCPNTRPAKEPSIYDNYVDASSKSCEKYVDATSAADSEGVVTNDSAYSEAKDRQMTAVTVKDSSLSRDIHVNNNDKEIVTEACQQDGPVHMNEHKVDNNLILLITLNVFEDEDERFLKMFRSNLGHTEGELRPVFILVTTRALYVLTSSSGVSNFHKEAVVTYAELDYISLSLNFQVINVVCTNRRKQLWLTTGSTQLTKSIISTIDSAIRQSDLELLRLSVLTDATTQKIAIKKWVAQESGQQLSDVTILCYVLVHWEDPRSTTSGTRRYGISHEGKLLQKNPGTMFTGAIWTSSYFVLRGGVLHKYADSRKSTPLMTVQLNCEECTGCRRMPQAERKHCFEIILSDGSTVQLCASSESELQSWLQSLCEAVADGIASPGSECMPCCGVLTTSKVFMCHEDVQTNFVRTLGSADVTDASAILVDSGAPCYCVLVFDSQEVSVSTEHWIIYFNAVLERDTFVQCLQQTWKMHYEVAALDVRQIDDIPLQKRCRDSIAKLKSKKIL